MTDENTTAILNMGLESLTTDAKATDDYSKQVEELVGGKIATLIKAGRLDEAAEEMLTLEKKCRQASDAISGSKLCSKIASMYKEAGQWGKTFEYFLILTKKRGQLRRATTDLVHLGMGWAAKMDKVKEKENRDKLMEVLDTVTEGKIFVEVERARLIKILADEMEASGKLDEAAQLLQEVQVETFGSMDKIEKAEYILNQMRLMLLRKDFIRVQIASRKINEKVLETEEFQDIKLEFYGNMIEYHLNEEAYFDAAEAYKKKFYTKKVEVDEHLWKPILSGWLLYLCLAVRSEKQEALMKEALDKVPRKKLEALQDWRQLVLDFQAKKLIAWPLKFEKELKAQEIFSDSGFGAHRWAILRRRVIQHNIRTVGTYYTRVGTPRLMVLLGLSQKELEAELAELVVSKAIYARIDRPAGVIRFGTEPKSEEKLSFWSKSIDKVLDLVKETGHLIQKERMIQEAKAKLKKK